MEAIHGRRKRTSGQVEAERHSARWWASGAPRGARRIDRRDERATVFARTALGAVTAECGCVWNYGSVLPIRAASTAHNSHTLVPLMGIHDLPSLLIWRCLCVS